MALEVLARAAKTGLWSHPNPVAPWEYRRNQRTSLQPVSDHRPGEIIYHGNRSSKVFHHPSCKDCNCKNCVIRFESRQEAVNAAQPSINKKLKGCDCTDEVDDCGGLCRSAKNACSEIDLNPNHPEVLQGRDRAPTEPYRASQIQLPVKLIYKPRGFL